MLKSKPPHKKKIRSTNAHPFRSKFRRFAAAAPVQDRPVSKFRLKKDRPIFKAYNPRPEQKQVEQMLHQQLRPSREQLVASRALNFETEDESNPSIPYSKVFNTVSAKGHETNVKIKFSGQKMRVLPPPPFPKVSVDFESKSNRTRFLSEMSSAQQWNVTNSSLYNGRSSHPTHLPFTSSIPLYNHVQNFWSQRAIHIPRLNSVLPPSILINNLRDWVNFQGGGLHEDVFIMPATPQDNNYGHWVLTPLKDIPPNTCLGFFPTSMLFQSHFPMWNILTGENLDQFPATFYEQLAVHEHAPYIRMFLELCNYFESPYRPFLDVLPKAFPSMPNLIHYPPTFDFDDEATHVFDPPDPEKDLYDPQAYLHPATHEALQLSKENEMMKYFEIVQFIDSHIPLSALKNHQYTPQVHNYIQKLWSSRSHQFPSHIPDQPFQAIVPVFEMANDSAFPNAQYVFDQFGAADIHIDRKKLTSPVRLSQMYDQALFVVSTTWIMEGEAISINRYQSQPTKFLETFDNEPVGPLTQETSMHVANEIFSTATDTPSMHYILQTSILRYPHLNGNSFANPHISYPQTSKFVSSGNIDLNQFLPYDSFFSQLGEDSAQELGHYFISPTFFQEGEQVSNIMESAGAFYKEAMRMKKKIDNNEPPTESEESDIDSQIDPKKKDPKKGKKQLETRQISSSENEQDQSTSEEEDSSSEEADGIVSPFDPYIEDDILETYYEILTNLNKHIKLSKFTQGSLVPNYGLDTPTAIFEKYNATDFKENITLEERANGFFDEDVPFRFGPNHISPQIESLCYLLAGGAMKTNQNNPLVWNKLLAIVKSQFEPNALNASVIAGVRIKPPAAPFRTEYEMVQWEKEYQTKINASQKQYENFSNNPLFSSLHQPARCVLLGLIESIISEQHPDIFVSHSAKIFVPRWGESIRLIREYQKKYAPPLNKEEFSLPPELKKLLNPPQSEFIPKQVNISQPELQWINIHEHHDENPFKLSPRQQRHVDELSITAMKLYENIPNFSLQHIFNSIALVSHVHARYWDIDSIAGIKTPDEVQISPVAHVKAQGALLRF